MSVLEESPSQESAGPNGGVAIPGTRLPSASIISPRGLNALCDHLRGQDRIALDTEFVRTRTFFARLGLIQICDGETGYLIDPIAVKDLSPLAPILEAERPVKVLYSCSEDLEVLYHQCGVVTHGIFDAQIAAGIVGYGFAGGYQALVKALLDVDIPKHATRTNWCKRPLSNEQLFYAIEDVEHLLQVHDLLAARLVELGRMSWAEEEFAALSDASKIDPDPDAYYLRLRQCGSMKPRQLAALRRLCAWREREARRRDRPRSYVVKDAVLVAMARRPPRSVDDFKRFDGIHPREIQRSHKTWLNILSEAESLPPEALPPDRRHRRRTAHFDRVVKALRAAAQTQSEELGVQSDLLAPRRLLEDVASRVLHGPQQTCCTSRDEDGWRADVLAGPFDEAVRNERPEV